MKKLINLTVAILTFSIILTSCNSTAPTSATDKNGDTKVAEGTTDERGFLSEATPEHPYYVSKEKLNLTAYISAPDTRYIQDWNETTTFQELEKITNVHFEFKSPPTTDGADAKQTFNLMVASNDLPDVFFGPPAYVGGNDKAVKDNVYADITELVAKYAPDLQKVIDSNDDIRKECLTDSSKIVAFPEIQQAEEPAWNGLWVRGDILKELNQEMPTTLDEWTNLLKLVKEKTDLIPMLEPFDNVDNSNGDGVFVGSFDTVAFDYYNRDGKVQYSALDPQIKDFLGFMRDWYADGLIYQDFYTNRTNNTLMQSLITSGQVFAFQRAYGDIGPFLASGRSTNPDYSLLAAPYPKTKTGEMPKIRNRNDYTKGCNLKVSAKTEYKKEIIEWANYGYTDAGLLLHDFGIEGKTYTMEPVGSEGFGLDGPFLTETIKAGGKMPVFTDFMLNNPDGLDFWSLIPKYKLHETIPHLRDPIAYQMQPEVIDSMEVWTNSATREFAMPPISLTPDEGQKFASIDTQVKTYLSEISANIITGKVPLEAYDKVPEQINAMGIQEAIKIKQDAFDRYNSK